MFGMSPIQFQDNVPHNRENWPEGLAKLSIPDIGIMLNPNEVDVVLDIHALSDNENTNLDNDTLRGLAQRIDDAWHKFDHEAVFVKLGSRSPKDLPFFLLNRTMNREWPKITHPNDVLVVLLGESERTYDDLAAAKVTEYNPWIWLREWIDIPKHQEFRCFQFEGRLAGVSQYFYNEYFEQIQNINTAKILQKIYQFHENFFHPVCHCNTVVFDVIVPDDDEVILLEINPFDGLTDPCLFTWTQPVFNEDLTINKKQKLDFHEFPTMRVVREQIPKLNIDKYLQIKN